MLPTERGEEGVFDLEALAAKVLAGPIKVDGVPQDDRGGDQVQPGGAVPLVLESSVTQLAQAIEEHGPG